MRIPPPARLRPFALAAAAALFGFGPAAGAADTFKVDPVHSMVVFKIGHLGVGNILGRINDPTGAVVEDADPAKMSFEIELKTDNIDTHNEKRDGHLKSPDFFNAKQFPAITFRSTSVKAGGQAGTYEVTGDLALHGVTKSITLPVAHVGSGKDPWGGFRSGYEATFKVNRNDYDIKFMPGGVGDDVTLMVTLEGVKK